MSNDKNLPNKVKKSIYLLPNIITAFSLSCGLFIIFKICLLEDNFDTYELVKNAALFLIIAGVADVLDGAVARYTNTESDFGVIFDSVSDAVTFGIAPPIILLQTIPENFRIEYSFLITVSAMIYSVCSVLRLVRYSVQQFRDKGTDTPKDPVLLDKHFTGLPTPAAACAAVSTALFLYSSEYHAGIYFDQRYICLIQASLLIFLGYCMISRWKFPSLKALQFTMPSFQMLFLITVVGSLALYGVYQHFSLVLVLGVWGYITTAMVLTLIRFVAGKKSKTLQDYEPEEEDF
jgi:CDP-diacylglycerol---serine O-phosphatidyltransferase